MRRIVDVVSAHDTAGDSVSLDYDRRSRRRMVMTTAAGAEIALDLPRPLPLRAGHGLVLDDGSIVRVDAAPEALIEIRARDVAALVRIAWHLGNRHLPTQLLPGADGGCLRIRADHVIADMAAGLGGTCTAIDAAFDPESGAYASAGEHHHHADHHGHGHGDHDSER